jgi:glutamyl-tRNA reductase
MTVSLQLVGLSHHVAPVELRERVAVDLEGAAALSQALAKDGCEAACLSTCNRTELYVAGGAEARERALAALMELAGDQAAELGSVIYRLSDEAAALHLFRVAAGLDSMVPGEGEILGQVRSAFEAGTPGPVLDRLFRQALHVGKKARSETAIGENPASVSGAAAALAQQVFGALQDRRVVLIGAGTAGELAARNLAARGAQIAAVASRSLERAQELADRFEARTASLDSVADELVDADVVVSSTGAPGLVLTRDQVEGVLRHRKGRPMFLIDIAVPRDLDPAINELDSCYLYDIDDLEAVVADSLAGRRREAARAEALAVEEAARFREWQVSREVVPAIASLRARAEEIRAGELARAENRLGRLTEVERQAVESVTAQIVNKLLHLPIVRMKEAAATADGPAYVDALEHLFGLEEERK